MFEYLNIKEKIKPDSLATLGNAQCFSDLSEWEAQSLIEACEEDSPVPCGLEKLEGLFKLLSGASKTLMFSYNDIRESSPISKACLEEKSEAVKVYLDARDPEWQNKMKIVFSNSVQRIIQMIFSCQSLDCSIIYLLDTIIDEKTVTRYHNYVNDMFNFASDLNERFYSRFYEFKYKKCDKKFKKELNRFRRYSDFKRAKLRSKFYKWAEKGRGPFQTHRIYKLFIQAPPLNSIYRLSSIMLCDYHFHCYFYSYLLILHHFIPDQESFEKAEADGFFENTDIDWKGFYLLTDGITRGEGKTYHDELYLFLKQANKNFYDYTGAFFRDLHDKMIFEPITFYFALISFVFSFLSLIQVLQGAKIIPALGE